MKILTLYTLKFQVTYIYIIYEIETNVNVMIAMFKVMMINNRLTEIKHTIAFSISCMIMCSTCAFISILHDAKQVAYVIITLKLNHITSQSRHTLIATNASYH